MVIHETEPIKIWKFQDAPSLFKEYIIEGSDEDWLALIPPNYKDEYIPFLEFGSEFGCCAVDEYNIHEGYYEGYKILIGCHS